MAAAGPAERHPKPVEIAEREFAHAIGRFVQDLDDRVHDRVSVRTSHTVAQYRDLETGRVARSARRVGWGPYGPQGWCGHRRRDGWEGQALIGGAVSPGDRLLEWFEIVATIGGLHLEGEQGDSCVSKFVCPTSIESG